MEKNIYSISRVYKESNELKKQKLQMSSIISKAYFFCLMKKNHPKNWKIPQAICSCLKHWVTGLNKRWKTWNMVKYGLPWG